MTDVRRLGERTQTVGRNFHRKVEDGCKTPVTKIITIQIQATPALQTPYYYAQPIINPSLNYKLYCSSSRYYGLKVLKNCGRCGPQMTFLLFYSHYKGQLGSIFSKCNTKVNSFYLCGDIPYCLYLLALYFVSWLVLCTYINYLKNLTFKDQKHYYFVLTFYTLKFGNFVHTSVLQTLTRLTSQGYNDSRL